MRHACNLLVVRLLHLFATVPRKFHAMARGRETVERLGADACV